MLRVSDAVRTIVLSDDVSFQAMEKRILNFSSYAAQILPEVEKKTMKAVKKGTIVAALTRFAEGRRNQSPMKPLVTLDDLSIRSPLCDIAFSKTATTRRKLAELNQKISLEENAFFTVTQSMSEITIIAPQSLQQSILAHFDTEPKEVFSELAGITVRFSEHYLSVPNVLYTIQAALAVHSINFIEIVSTYTELSFILDQKYLEIATHALRQFFN